MAEEIIATLERLREEGCNQRLNCHGWEITFTIREKSKQKTGKRQGRQTGKQTGKRG